MIKGLLNKILEEKETPSNIVELSIIDGVKMKFKILVDVEERLKIEAESLEWAKATLKMYETGTALPVWKEVEIRNLGILAQVKMLSLCCLEEEFQKEISWMTLAKKVAPVFTGTVTALDQCASNEAGDYAVFINEKKDLSETLTTQSNAE